MLPEADEARLVPGQADFSLSAEAMVHEFAGAGCVGCCVALVVLGTGLAVSKSVTRRWLSSGDLRQNSSDCQRNEARAREVAELKAKGAAACTPVFNVSEAALGDEMMSAGARGRRLRPRRGD